MIRASNLSRYYGKRPGVTDIHFTIQENQIVGLLGPNGAGKSTIMKMLAGYQLPTAGTIEIDGRDILEVLDQHLMCVGFLPENPPLYPEMEAEELLLFTASVKGIQKAERAEHVQKIMELTQITHVKDRLVKNLSKGYRQRVGLAQALIGLPKIIILDEPTVGMDPAQICEVRRLLEQLKKDHTIIVSSHILAEIAEICDWIIVINKGRLVLEESMDELRHGKMDDDRFILRTTAGTEALERCLADVEGIGSITETQDGLYLVQADDSDELRSRVAAAMVGAGLPVLEMKRSGHSLEEIFLKLTAD